MKKLAEKGYWDSIYKPMNIKEGERELGWRRLKNWLKNASRDYSNYIMWEVLLPKYLPKYVSKDKNLKIIEIGCAPGKYLLNFHKQFGYTPCGVEYSEKGVQITKNNFEKAALNPNNIIQADFFDDDFLDKNKEQFDLVFSRGFIEHYDDVKSVVQRHLSLVKSHGYIIISIPNLGGLNQVLGKAFNIDSYNLHNTSIMNLESFNGLFPDQMVEKIYSDYVGLFSFGLFNTNSRSKYFLHRVLLLVQRPFDFLLRILFGNYVLKSKYLSPYLMFIGRKK